MESQCTVATVRDGSFRCSDARRASNDITGGARICHTGCRTVAAPKSGSHVNGVKWVRVRVTRSGIEMQNILR
jgi:hypothetical protein